MAEAVLEMLPGEKRVGLGWNGYLFSQDRSPARAPRAGKEAGRARRELYESLPADLLLSYTLSTMVVVGIRWISEEYVIYGKLTILVLDYAEKLILWEFYSSDMRCYRGLFVPT